jgi:hypothetical protein
MVIFIQVKGKARQLQSGFVLVNCLHPFEKPPDPKSSENEESELL